MEKTKNWRLIEYVTPIKVIKESNTKEDSEVFMVGGSAINETITRNNVKYTAEELRSSANTLVDKPILKDHEARIDNIIGRVKEAYFDETEKAIKFRGQIMEKKYQEMITDGRLNNVSIGAQVRDIKEETQEDGSIINVAEGIEFLELSIVAIPGDAMATFSQALSENFELKKKSEDVKKVPIAKKIKMEEKTMETKQTTEQDSQIKALTEQVKAFENKERLALIEKYKSLAEAKATVVEGYESLSVEALNVLISQLNTVKEAEKEEEEDKGVVKTKDEKEETLDEKYGSKVTNEYTEVWNK